MLIFNSEQKLCLSETFPETFPIIKAQKPPFCIGLSSCSVIILGLKNILPSINLSYEMFDCLAQNTVLHVSFNILCNARAYNGANKSYYRNSNR